MSLRVKFILYTAITIVLIIVAVNIFISRHEENILTDEVLKRGLAISKALAENAEDPLAIGDILTLSKSVSDAKKNHEGVVYCQIVDYNGVIRASTAESEVGQPYQAEDLRSLKDEPYLAQLRKIEAGKVYDIAVPVMIKDKKIGVVHLGLSRASIDRAVSETTKGLLIITGIILAVSLGFIFFILSILTRSLSRITEEVVAIGNGNLDRRIEDKGSDEVGRIAQAVDEMAKKLKKAREDLIERERMRREMQIAKEIQLALLPKGVPEFPGFEIATFYRSAMEVGGDYYDFFKIDDHRFGTVVGDVSGKGVGGSLLMAMVRTILRFQVLESPDPIKLLSILNYLLEKEIPEDMFVTIFYCLFDRNNNEVQFASAGHNPAVIQRDSDLIKLNPAGPPIGIIDGRSFAKSIQASSIFLNPRDLFVLTTDGVIDAQNHRGERFGEEKFYNLLKENPAITANGFRDLLVETLEQFTGDLPQEDDVTMVAIRRL